jgi:ribonuclease-3
MATMHTDFAPFEKTAGVTFKDKGLLRQAFVHRSYINENKDAGFGHNERLEFLGDAVLELVITDYLFAKYPDKTEGDMTLYRSALVNANTLARVATDLGVNDFLILSKGEAKDTGRARQYILANTLEAIIGAMYLDQGYDMAKGFVLKHISTLIEEIVSSGSWMDAKSRFQERAQEIAELTPQYKTVKESGPDHDKKFTVGVFIGNEMVATGDGKSKQDAEQEAARKALEAKEW